MTKLNLNERDLQNFRKVFEIFDKDGSGSINKQEIQSVFKQLNIKLNKTQLNKIMVNFDASGDGLIQFQQFLEVIAAHFAQPQSEQWIFQVFQTIDQDCDGLLSKSQLLKIAKLYNLQIEQKDIDLMIQIGDQHGQGGINYQEFSKILKIQTK